MIGEGQRVCKERESMRIVVPMPCGGSQRIILFKGVKSPCFMARQQSQGLHVKFFLLLLKIQK